MTGSAAADVGSDEDFLFLASDEIELAHPVSEVWRLVEGDHQERLLRALSRRFVGREITATLADGYRCTTTSRTGLGRRRSFESVIWIDEPRCSVELQIGVRTELRCTSTYRASGAGTVVAHEQAFRARSTTFESGQAISALQRRAVQVVADRLRAVADVVAGGTAAPASGSR